jgi:hypothetical protein
LTRRPSQLRRLTAIGKTIFSAGRYSSYLRGSPSQLRRRSEKADEKLLSAESALQSSARTLLSFQDVPLS